MKKKIVSMLLALALVFAFAACGGTAKNTPALTTPTPAPVVSDTPDAESETRVFVDSVGRKIEIDKSIERVAASGSMAQMILFALCPEKLVGISSAFDDATKKFIPEEYANLPVLGNLYGTELSINLEELAAVDPQIIIDIGEPKGTIHEDLDGLMEQVGVPAVHITATLSTMADTYRMLGELVGEPEKAERIAQYCEKVYGRGAEIAAEVGENAPSVVYCLGDKGLNVLAKSSFHAELLDLMTNNIAIMDEPSSRGSGNETDMEQLLLWNPDVIFFAPDSVYDSVGGDATWGELTAIGSGEYYKVPAAPYNWMGSPPSVNRYLGILWLPVVLYPELVDYDLYEEVKEYFELFYHVELNPAQFAEVRSGSLPTA